MIGVEKAVLRAVRQIERFSAKGWGRTSCPLCESRKGTADRRQSFGFKRDTGAWHCFRCHARGTVRNGEVLDVDGLDDDLKADLGPPEAYYPLWREPGISSIIHAPARKYLLGREIDRSTTKLAQIGACATGRLAGRVVVPVLDRNGREWVGWSARLWTDYHDEKVPKYLTATGMERHNTVYNSGALFEETRQPCLVVEGVFDALPYLPHAVALLGKPSEGQIQLLMESRRPLIVALDGDAWIEGEMLALRLQFEGVRSSWVRLPPRTDPGSIDRSWLRSEAESLASQI